MTYSFVRQRGHILWTNDTCSQLTQSSLLPIQEILALFGSQSHLPIDCIIMVWMRNQSQELPSFTYSVCLAVFRVFVLFCCCCLFNKSLVRFCCAPGSTMVNAFPFWSSQSSILFSESKIPSLFLSSVLPVYPSQSCFSQYFFPSIFDASLIMFLDLHTTVIFLWSLF